MPCIFCDKPCVFSGVYICKFFVPVVMIFFGVFHDLSAMPLSANIKTGRRLLLTSRFFVWRCLFYVFNELCIKRFAACANVYEHCHDGYIYERKLSRAEYVASVHCHECHNEVYEYYCRCRAGHEAEHDGYAAQSFGKHGKGERHCIAYSQRVGKLRAKHGKVNKLTQPVNEHHDSEHQSQRKENVCRLGIAGRGEQDF